MLRRRLRKSARRVMPPANSDVHCRKDPVNWIRVTVPLTALGADSSARRIPSGRMEASIDFPTGSGGSIAAFSAQLSIVRTRSPQETVTVPEVAGRFVQRSRLLCPTKEDTKAILGVLHTSIGVPDGEHTACLKRGSHPLIDKASRGSSVTYTVVMPRQ